MILGDQFKAIEDSKELRDCFIRLYIQIVETACLLTTTFMFTCNKHIAFAFLYLFLCCAAMENLNIHETVETNNSNANARNLTPAELLDCCLVGKLLINKPIRFNALKDRF
ncbi:hypothetical protein A2U01_0048579, partial [Trifolium medium]|nr:hypothetical protein [Trifolium medium]